MTTRDLFRLLIKLFGVYSLIVAFFSFTGQSLLSISFNSNIVLVILWIIFMFLVVFGVYLFLIFKTDFIIDKLKLDKGFDNEKLFANGVSNYDIIKLAIILIGGFLLINNIPRFLSHVIMEGNSHLNKISHFSKENYPFYFDWFGEAVSIVIGFIFIIKYKSISLFFNKK